jgi:ABC-type antimicrobial peptide transport system permease subunit
VTVRIRAAVRERLESDPLRRGLLGVLTGTGAAAALLALLGVALATARTLRDGAAEHADLEADGLPPGALRRLVGTQGAAMALAGVAGGGLLGAALAPLAPAVVRAAEGGGASVPPLTAAPSPGAGLALLLVAVLFGGVVAAAVARRAFREPWPVRPPAGERA